MTANATASLDDERPSATHRPLLRAVALASSVLAALSIGGIVVKNQAPAAQAAPLPVSVVMPMPTGSSATAPLGSSGLSDLNPLDELGRPTDRTAAAIRNFAAEPWLPPAVRSSILTALEFSRGSGNPNAGVPLVSNGPAFRQFYWPTVAGNCINGELNSVGSAIAVPGPSDIPAPGAGPGEVVFLFTALGTAPAQPDQGDMTVHWVNLSRFTSGSTALGYHGVNPEGPATLSGTAATGPGVVIAWLSGAVRTTDATCTYAPTAAIVEVR